MAESNPFNALAEMFKIPKEKEFDNSVFFHKEQFWVLRRFIKGLFDAFDAAHAKMEADWTEKLKEKSEEERDQHMDSYGEDVYELTVQLPAIAWGSTLVSIVSVLEHEVVNLARLMARLTGKTFDNSRLKGSSLISAVDFLRVECGVSFNKSVKLWEDNQTYIKIRNAITHNGSTPKGEDFETIEKYAEKSEGKVSLNGATLTLTKEFCVEALANVEKLFDELAAAARLKVPPGEFYNFM